MNIRLLLPRVMQKDILYTYFKLIIQNQRSGNHTEIFS